ncbi:MAG: transaldolase family protein [Spirochaetales bacterium]|nr:transaldolase family protein [Spirochaetales bacterium]
MEYLADTADLEAIKQLFDYFPMSGVTTNPTILKQSGMKLSEAVKSIQNIIGDNSFHIQVMSEDCDNIVKEAKAYKNYFDFGDNYYSKIPITMEGLKAMRILKDSGINVTATAIFTQQQALIAAKAGADYVAPYVSRLDNISSHGIDVVRDIAENMTHYKLDSKVLAASFKTVDQIHRVSMHGCHSVTVNPELLYQLIKHPMTDISIETFLKDGKGVYDIEI